MNNQTKLERLMTEADAAGAAYAARAAASYAASEAAWEAVWVAWEADAALEAARKAEGEK